MWKQHNLSATRRGYGRAHQKRRAALLPFAINKPCPLCGEVMRASDPLDLDHSMPIALGGVVGDRIVHRRCNNRAGAQLGHAISQGSVQSRNWTEEPRPQSRAW